MKNCNGLGILEIELEPEKNEAHAHARKQAKRIGIWEKSCRLSFEKIEKMSRCALLPKNAYNEKHSEFENVRLLFMHYSIESKVSNSLSRSATKSSACKPST